MDEIVLKVTIAAFLHDIGKLAEDGMEASQDFLDRHAALYQPLRNGRPTHRHALYTAAFIDDFEKLLPRSFNKANWGLEDAFMNLAAGHHKPETPMQWIIAMADRISSGWDRKSFEEYNESVAWQDYRKTRIIPLLESVLKNGSGPKAYRYRLQELSPESIFPLPESEACPRTNEEAREEYKRLFNEFVFALERLEHRDISDELWFDHFEGLMMLFASAVPSVRAGKINPDVSLYDHSRITAALATALYLYHRDSATMDAERIQDPDPKKFLFVTGDFYGIQHFIFSEGGEVGKHRSKILRGRSFAVSLISELAAVMICREAGLPSTSIVLNAGGKFTILAPNTERAHTAIEEAEQKVNDWLMRISFGESSLGISSIEAAPRDFLSGNFSALFDKLNEQTGIRKLKKIPIDRFGVVQGYLDSFNNDLAHRLCPLCGKRPSVPEAENAFDGRIESSCAVCRDHVFLGMHLVREERIAVTTVDADIHGRENKLLEPIFDTFQVTFASGGLRDLARSGDLVRYWDISLSKEGALSKDVTRRFINGYIPRMSDEDNYDERYLEGLKSDQKKLELITDPGSPKTFGHIALMARNRRPDGKYKGIEALGILKADVDQLGKIMSCGLTGDSFTLSRLASISRQINHFFCLYLPHLLATDKRFQDVYTVFAGGDDLFLIGPWNRIIELAGVIHSKFRDYACKNENVHLSAGIIVCKPNTPVPFLAEASEDALEASKLGGRDRITVFGSTVTWDEFFKLTAIRDEIISWQDKGMVNNAMLYRLNTFLELAEKEKMLLENGADICLDDIECLKWRSMFSYSAARNIGKAVKGEARKSQIQEFTRSVEWLQTHGAAFRIALWEVLYNQR